MPEKPIRKPAIKLLAKASNTHIRATAMRRHADSADGLNPSISISELFHSDAYWTPIIQASSTNDDIHRMKVTIDRRSIWKKTPPVTFLTARPHLI
jgi:hypothetical protein